MLISRKLFLVCLCFNIFVYANNNINYTDALNLFNEKNYKDSYKYFNHLSTTNTLKNSKIDFYLGLSAYKLEMFEEAMIAYERVLIEDPSHLRTKLELARVHISLKQFEHAKVYLEEVLETNPPKTVQNNINILLKNIKNNNSDTKKLYSIFFSLALGYDDNIYANPVDEKMSEYLQDKNLNFNLDEDTKTSYIQAILGLNYLNKLTSSDNFYFLHNMFLYTQEYKDNSSNNILYAQLGTSLNYQQNNYFLSIPIELDKMYYGQEHLLGSKSVALNLGYKFDNNIVSTFGVKYKQKRYNQTKNHAKDSNIYNYSININKKFIHNNLNFKYYYQTEKKDNNKSDYYIDKHSHNFIISSLIKINSDYSLKLSYQHSLVDYKYAANYMEGFNTYNNTLLKYGKRKDKINSILTTLSKKLTNKMNINLNYNFIQNNSNHLPSIYNKNTVSINFNIRF